MYEPTAGYFILRLMHFLGHGRYSLIDGTELYQCIYQDSLVRIRLIAAKGIRPQRSITVELLKDTTPEVWQESPDDVIVFRASDPRADTGQPQAKKFPDWVADLHSPGEWEAYLTRVSDGTGFWMF